MKRAINAVSHLSIAAIIGAFSSFAFQVLLARSMSPEHFGAFITALAAATLAGPLACFGAPTLMLSLYGKSENDARHWVRAVFAYVFIGTVLFTALLWIWAFAGGYPPQTRTLILLISPSIVAYAATEMATVFHQMASDVPRVALLHTLTPALRLACALLIVSGISTVSPTAAGIGVAAAAIVATKVSIFGILRQFRKISRTNELSHQSMTDNSRDDKTVSARKIRPWNVMCEAWPFGLSTALHLIYFQIGVLIVERLAGNYSAALYGVAFTIVSAVYLLPTVIFQKLVIPKYHRWAAQDKIRLLAAFQLSAGIMFLTGLGLLALTSTLANTLINLFFGQAYTNGSKVLIILCIGIPFRLISTCCGAALVTREYSKKRLTCMGIVAFVSLGLSIPLTLKYGAIGTAAAAVTSEAILMILYLWIAANYVFGKNTFSNWFKFRTTLETIK